MPYCRDYDPSKGEAVAFDQYYQDPDSPYTSFCPTHGSHLNVESLRDKVQSRWDDLIKFSHWTEDEKSSLAGDKEKINAEWEKNEYDGSLPSALDGCSPFSADPKVVGTLGKWRALYAALAAAWPIDDEVYCNSVA